MPPGSLGSHASLLSCDVLGRLSVGGVLEAGRRSFPSAALIASSARFGEVRLDGPMTGEHARVESLEVQGEARVAGDLVLSSIAADAKASGSWAPGELSEGLDLVLVEASQSLLEAVVSSDTASTKWSAKLRSPRPLASLLLSCSDGRLRVSYDIDDEGRVVSLELESCRKRALPPARVTLLAVFSAALAPPRQG